MNKLALLKSALASRKKNKGVTPAQETAEDKGKPQADGGINSAQKVTTPKKSNSPEGNGSIPPKKVEFGKGQEKKKISGAMFWQKAKTR